MHELIKDDVKVELEDIGEGSSGDYDEDDPDDERLLRFTVYKRDPEFIPPADPSPFMDYNEWLEVDDASYCTNLPADLSEADAQAALEIIMVEVHGHVHNTEEPNIKKLCERLSWIGASWLKEGVQTDAKA